jgi:hypothetical protein
LGVGAANVLRVTDGGDAPVVVAGAVVTVSAALVAVVDDSSVVVVAWRRLAVLDPLPPHAASAVARSARTHTASVRRTSA